MRAIAAAGALFLCLFLLPSAWTQDMAQDLAAGLQPYQSYHGSDLDQVSLSNGNLHVRIPLISYPQRGGKLKLDYALEFNGKPQTIHCVPNYPDPGCAGYAWVRSNDTNTSFHAVDEQDIKKGTHAITYTIGSTGYTYMMTSWSTPDGAGHPGAPITSVSGQSGQVSLDGSGYYDGYNDLGTCSVHCYTTDSSGVSYYPSSGIKREDSNGNWIATATDGTLTDTMGRVIPPLPAIPIQANSNSSTGCTGSLPIVAVTTWQVPGENGSPLVYKFCYAAITLNIPAGAYGGAADGLSLAPPVTTTNYRYIIKLQSVVLPNNQTWMFEYNSQNPGDPAPPAGQTWNYGDLTKITFPTGGSISYTYHLVTSISTEAMWVQTRTVKTSSTDPGSTWHYYLDSWSSTATVMRVTDPLGNDTVHNFTNLGNGNLMETSTKWYAGSSGSGNVLKSSVTSYWSPGIYVNAHDPAATETIAMPTSVVTTLGNGHVTETDTAYCCSFTASWEGGATGSMNYGKPWDVKIYDYGSGAAGPLLQEKKTTYFFQSNSSYLTSNLLDLASAEDVYDGGGSHLANTSYNYDEGQYLTASGLGVSEQLNTSPLTGVRGNLTSTTHWLSSGSSPVAHTNWYDSGEAYKVIDAKGNAAATFAYSSSVYWGGFPTSITNALGQSTRYVYDSGGLGVKTSVTDPNNKTTSYGHDALGRLTSVTYPDLGQLSYTYDDLASPVNVVFTKMMSSSQSLREEVDLDGFGREWYTKLTTEPQGTVYTERTYDALGRLYQEWNPTRCVLPGSSSCSNEVNTTWGITTHQYDALNRPTVLTQPDSSTRQQGYAGGNTVDFYDETGRHWQRTSDALGRLTKVLEPDSSNNPTLETDYQYSALGNLTRVDQWGGASGNSGDRVRTFSYDSLSRLLTASNPETGTVCYGVWSGSSCVSGYDANGNVNSKTDARGLKVNYSYDALNRITGKSASDSSFNYSYTYDVATTPGGFTSSNPIGRLVEASNGINASSQYSYDAMGRVVTEANCIPSNCTQTGNAFQAQYDLAGNITSLTYPDGRVAAEAWDAAGHISQVANGSLSGYSYLTAAQYWPNGTPEGLYHGNGVADGLRLNNRLQPVGIGPVRLGTSFGTGSGPGSYSPNVLLSGKVYCYGPAATTAQTAALPCPSLGSANNGNILQILDRLNSNNSQAFSYDNLNRLGSFTNGSGTMQQTYSVDPWGNMAMSGTASSGLVFAAASNNRDTSGTLTYDASGNVTSVYNGISRPSLTYDAEGKILTAGSGSASYTYDANGNRVRKDASGTWTEYLYFDGQPLAEKSADGTWSDYLYANGQRMARADGYDIRLHMSGTNCSGTGCSTNTVAGTLSITAANGYVIRSGDVLSWRQYQTGVANGGIDVYCTDNTDIGLVGKDSDGQPMETDSTMNSWHVRTVDLSTWAGKTIKGVFPGNWASGGGSWEQFFGDIVLTSTDGTSITLYSRTLSSQSPFMGPGVIASSLSVITEKVADTDPLTTTTYYHGDQVGSTQVVTVGTGWPVASYIYYPYGQGPAPGSNHYLFNGKERDQESGNDYFGARYYNSAVGRFMSPDWSAIPAPVPYANLSDPQSLNLYAYVANNPISRSDRDGHLITMQQLYSYHNGAQALLSNFMAVLGDQMQQDLIASLQNNNPGQANAPQQEVQQQSVPMSTSTYKTATGAAKAALDAIIGQSEKSGWEYAGRIVKLANGKYAYTLPTTMKSNSTSDFDGGMLEGTRIPAGTTDAGMYHTHPTGGGSNPDLFSGADNAIAVREHLPSYMESGATRNIYLLDGSKRTSILDPTPPTVIRYGPPQ